MVQRITETLTAIIRANPVDWHRFRDVLCSVEDINIIDEKYEETILSELILNGAFLDRGELLPVAIQQFIQCGYDVQANEGRNGGVVLHSLCFASYDRHIIDAAKVLLHAGAPIIFRSNDDDPGTEPGGLLEAVDYHTWGAWMSDKAYDYAMEMETYLSLLKACRDGKEYDDVRSHFDCIGKSVTGVSAIAGDIVYTGEEKPIYEHQKPIVLWFDSYPLVLESYADLMVDGVYVSEHKAELIDVSADFSSLLGARLDRVCRVHQTICVLDFSNGVRLICSGRKTVDKARVEQFEIRKVLEAPNICDLSVDAICGDIGHVFSSTVRRYSEDSLALFCGEEAYLVYPERIEPYGHRLVLLPCSPNLLTAFQRLYPVAQPLSVDSYFDGNALRSMRLNYNGQFLYLHTTDYFEIEVELSNQEFVPDLDYALPDRLGNRIDFTRRFVVLR